MKRRIPYRYGTLAGLVLLAACSSDSDPAPTPEPLACADITGEALGMGNLRVAETETVAATDDAPGYCKVVGYLDERISPVDDKPYAIGFEGRLPDNWNGRFYFQGGGGTDGSIQPAVGNLPGAGNTTNALAMGFAVFSTDGGHTSENVPVIGGALFGVDPQARIDYGYNAVGQVTAVGKRIVERFYGNEADYSYFVGCSNGGRQAMVAASRFADQFDGVIAGNAGFNLPQSGVQHAWDVQAEASVAPLYSDGKPIISQAFSPGDLTLLADTTLQTCDALDGLEDGMIDNPPACAAAFDPTVLTCAAGKTDSCLTAGQVNALQAMFDGPVNSAGEALYSNWPYDTGVASFGWRIWKLGTSDTSTPNAIIATLGGGALPYVFVTPPDTVSGENNGVLDYLLAFDFDRDAPRIFATTDLYSESAMSFMTPPNPASYESFKARGGKMLVYHGNSDPVFSVNDTIRWYNDLRANHGAEATSDFARLFTIPGMTHCSGGPATDKFDMLGALTNWVEHGEAPAQVTAYARADNPDAAAFPDRSRPLCPYPQQPRYSGSGSIEDASNFSCVMP